MQTQLTNVHSSTAERMEHELQGHLLSERGFLVIQAMKTRTAPFELTDIAVAVATREDGIDANDEETIDRVKLSLHHNHLPKLAELNVLDYDHEAHVIDV